MTIALSEACIYAARASNRLLGQLWADGSIAQFGYFDAQYIFSSTIVLMISNTLKPNQGDQESIDLAWGLLQSMVDDGNLPAREFIERLSSLRRDLDELRQQSGDRPATAPEKGYITPAGTFAAHVTPQPWMLARGAGGRGDGRCLRSEGPVDSPSSLLAGEGLQGALLDDPFIQDFLGQPDSEWSPSALNMSTDEVGSWSLAWDSGNILREIEQ